MGNERDINLRVLADDKDCQYCKSKGQCLGKRLEHAEQVQFSGSIRRRRIVPAGERLVTIGDSIKSVYAVKSGALKSHVHSYCGTNLISSFYFPGDIIGLESIGARRYQNEVVTLETTTICEIAVASLVRLSESSASFQRHLFQLLARRIRLTEQAIVYGKHLHAEVRLLMFLRDLCSQCGVKRIGNGAVSIKLPMSKSDIAAYLGLRAESVSRSLKKLEQRGIIQNVGRSIRLTNEGEATNLICSETGYR